MTDLLEAAKSPALPEWVRYILAVFTVTLYWNHILTIPGEVAYIWKRPFTEIKILFVACRYMAAASFIVLFFGLSGLFEAGSDTLLAAMCIYDRRLKHVIYVLRGAFVLCWGVVTMCMVLTMLPIIHAVKFDDKLFHMCLVPYAPRYGTGVWAAQIVFELVVIVMTILNAASRPSTIRVKVISDLIRDCFISSVAAFFEIAAIVDTAILVTIVTRLILRVERLLDRSEPRSGVEMVRIPHASDSAAKQSYCASSDEYRAVPPGASRSVELL
ncbi:hypothetical protein BC834DRAFT_845626 [Gloeopeniophorella convolvens]|nr:hypothetical protein BC834DRAFT_845626 [Gloeopeniophorella convolvens]